MDTEKELEAMRTCFTIDEMAIKEYEVLQAEKNSRMTQVRLVIWSLFFASLTGFVVAGLQSSLVAYAIAFYPLIAACLARLAGHNEAIINRLKAYLLDFEDWHAAGYEHFCLECKDRSGSQNKALRDVLTATALLAAGVVVWRLMSDGLIIIAVAVLIVECVPVVLCWRWMADKKVAHTCKGKE